MKQMLYSVREGGERREEGRGGERRGEEGEEGRGEGKGEVR